MGDTCLETAIICGVSTIRGRSKLLQGNDLCWRPGSVRQNERHVGRQSMLREEFLLGERLLYGQPSREACGSK
jgi:hypothetical protein